MEFIIESLAAITKTFNSRMMEFQQDIHKTLPMTATCLASDFNNFKTFVLSALSGLQSQTEFLAKEIDRTEMQKRRKVLLFHGVSEKPFEDATTQVTKLVAEHLELPHFSSGCIKTCHRLGRPLENKTRPIVVKFSNMANRNKIWFAKTKLKGTGVTVSEFLTRNRHKVFQIARKRFGLKKCWTRNGWINIIGSDGFKYYVECLTDLASVPVQVSHLTHST